MGRSNTWIVVAGVLGVAVGLALRSPAQAQDKKAGGPGAFSYHPQGAQTELCDTRNGTIYRRNLSGTWEVFTRLPE